MDGPPRRKNPAIPAVPSTNDVASGIGPSWWAATAVEAYPRQTADVLLYPDTPSPTPPLWAVFRSSDPGWSWTSIANGTVNSQNLDTYGATGRRMTATGAIAAGSWATAWCPAYRPCLLGGYLGSGNAPFIGGGSYANTAQVFQQDGNCTVPGTGASYGGDGDGVWGRSASVYVR